VLPGMCLSDSGEAEPSHDAICMRVFSVSEAPPPRTGGGATSHGLSPVRLSDIGKIYCQLHCRNCIHSMGAHVTSKQNSHRMPAECSMIPTSSEDSLSRGSLKVHVSNANYDRVRVGVLDNSTFFD
jgi:hypothetical protein